MAASYTPVPYGSYQDPATATPAMGAFNAGAYADPGYQPWRGGLSWLNSQPTSTYNDPATLTSGQEQQNLDALPANQRAWYNQQNADAMAGGYNSNQWYYNPASMPTAPATTPVVTPTSTTTTPTATPAPPAKPVVTNTTTLNTQSQAGDWTAPNTTAQGNSFTGNPVNQTGGSDTGTNYFGPSYNAGSFDQTVKGAGQFGTSATPTTSLLDDGGGVSASPMGMPPGLSGQSPTPPIYYNPAVYSGAGAPINRGVSQNSVPSFAAMAVPTYHRGGGIPPRVQHYAAGGGVDDPEGDQVEQDMQYMDMSSPSAAPQAAPQDMPAPDAQDVSNFGASYPTGGVPRMGIGGGGMPRMSMGSGAPRAGGRNVLENIGSDIDLAEDSPTYGQPLPKSDQGPIDQNGDASPSLLGALAGAIQHIFGQTQPGQRVPDNSQTADARRQFVSGEGGESPEDVAELHQAIDPSHAMDNGMRNLSGLYAVYNHHLMNNDIAGANQAASAMLIYSSNLAAKYGDEAVRRYYGGDIQGAVDNLKEAYNHTPDGMKVDAQPNRDGTWRVTQMNQADKVKWQGDVAPQEILGAAIGMKDKSLFWHTIQTQAAQAGNVEARQKLTDEEADASAARISASRHGGGGGEGGGGNAGWVSYTPPSAGGSGGAPKTAIPVQGEKPPVPFKEPGSGKTLPEPTNPADHPGEIIRADTPESTVPTQTTPTIHPAPTQVASADPALSTPQASPQEAEVPPNAADAAAPAAPTPNASVPSAGGIPVSDEQLEQNVSDHWENTIKPKYLSPQGYPVRQTADGGYQMEPPPQKPDYSGLRPAEAREVEAQYKQDYAEWYKDYQASFAQAKADQGRWETDYRYAQGQLRASASASALEDRREKSNLDISAREDKRVAAQTTAATTADTRKYQHENYQDDMKRKDAIAAEERAGYTKATTPMSLEETNKIFTGTPTDITAREDNEPISWLAQAAFPNDADGKPIAPKDAKVQFGATFKPNEQIHLGNSLKVVQSSNPRMPTEEAAAFVAGVANGSIMLSGSEQPMPGDAANGNRHVIAYANKDGSNQGMIYVPDETMQNIVNIRNAHAPKEQEAASPYANDYGRTLGDPLTSALGGARRSVRTPYLIGVPDQFGGLSPAGGIPAQNATPESTEGGEAAPRPATRSPSPPNGPPSGPRFGIAPPPGGHGGYSIENAPADIIRGIQNHPWFNPPKMPRGRGYVGQP